MHVKLIVPEKWNSNDVAHRRLFPDNVEYWGKAIADIAGGFTASQATGGWTDGQGQLIVEPATVFDIEHDINAFPPILADDCPDAPWYALVRRIAKELHQTCVYLEIDGIVEYVKA